LPSYSLSAGEVALAVGDSFEDYKTLNFKVWDNVSSIKSATITFDDQEYKLDPQKQQSLDIDFAGNVGEKSATIFIEDTAGNILHKTFQFHVVTSVDSMKHLIDRFIDSKELSGDLIPQLTNSLNQVQHQLEKGNQEQAMKKMQDFVKRLNNEDLSKYITDHANEILNNDAESVINTWKN
jgi:hypothetical protein